MKLIQGGLKGAELKLAKSAGAYSEQSASVLAGILESADEMFAALDAGQRFVAFNGAFRREFTEAFKQAPKLGQALPDALAGFAQQQAAAAELIRRAFGGEAFKIEREMAGPGLRSKFYEVNISPVLNTEGKAVVVALVARDITEKREAESKFRRLLEASPDAMLIVRADKIELINAQAEAMFGYAHQALLGKPLELLVPAKSRERHVQHRAAYETSPKTRPMGIGMSLSGVRADGTEFPVEISLSPLNVTGETVVAAAIRDMSARKRTEDDLRRRIAELETNAAHQATKAAQSQQYLQAQIQAGQERERSLAQSSEQYRAVFEQAAVGIAITTPDGRFLKVNPCYCQIGGYEEVDLLQLRVHDITHPDDVEVHAALDGKLLSRAINSYTLETRFLRKDGHTIWGAVAVSIKCAANGDPMYFLVVMEDITRRRLIEQKLAEAQMRLHMAVGIARLGFWEWNPETNETYFSPEWKEQLGYTDQDLPSNYNEWKSRVHPEDAERIMQTLAAFVAKPRGEYRVELRLRHCDGSYRWFLAQAIAIEDPPGKVKKVIGVRRDITDQKETERQICRAAKHDPLTGLPNRALLYEYADHILAASRRSGLPGAIMFVDLDRFKEINDIYGHEAGDAVLREVAKRLSASTRKGDIAGRLGGDEFLVILPQVSSEFTAASVAEHVLARLNQSYRVGDIEVSMSPSIGVAMFPDDGDGPDTLISNADHAMYEAKETGGCRIQFFTDELAHRADEAKALENQFRAALKRNEFQLYFQAIVNTRTDGILGAEALLRWRRQPGEIVMPAEFVPMAEAAGLAVELDEWVIHAACRQQLQWRQHGMPPLVVAINVAAVQLQRKDFLAAFAGHIHDYRIDPAFVQLELKESAVIRDLDAAQRIVHGMRELGVRVALDNFGTGACGLGALSRLHVNTLKIDPSFARSLDHDPESEAVMEAALAMGGPLKLEIVAAGVESAQSLIFLRDHGCELAQGFHLCEPMPACEFERWYRARVK